MAERSKKYVEALDLVRALTIVSVIAVHSTWYTANGGGWVASGALLSLLHFTRESFMAMTGFVLTWSLFGKRLAWPAVWAKRYRLVLFPYLIWSFLYLWLFKPQPTFLGFWTTYGRDLLNGGAWFHLYYLLITMQFYLVLPLFLLLMRWGQKRPWTVFWGTAAFQLLLMAYDQYGLSAHPGGLNAYTGDEVWSYALYFVMGGLAALHWSHIREWLFTHGRLVGWIVVSGAGIMLSAFGLQWQLTHNLTLADAVLQPAMVPWSVAIIVGLGWLGVQYEEARIRRPGRWPLVALIADLSFGIYLFHPMLLQWWTNGLNAIHGFVTGYPLDALTVVVVTAGSTVTVRVLSWFPFSPWVIGRSAAPRPSWLRWRRPLSPSDEREVPAESR